MQGRGEQGIGGGQGGQGGHGMQGLGRGQHGAGGQHIMLDSGGHEVYIGGHCGSIGGQQPQLKQPLVQSSVTHTRSRIIVPFNNFL